MKYGNWSMVEEENHKERKALSKIDVKSPTGMESGQQVRKVKKAIENLKTKQKFCKHGFCE